MKKLLLLITSFVLGFVLIGCSSASKEEKKGIDVEKLDPKNPVTIKVGASNVPHAVLLEHVAPQLEKEGIKLDIITYQDYYIPNKTLNDKEIDINYFQHVPFLKNAIKENGYKIEDAGAVHLEPIGLYSKKVKNVKDLKDGAKVLVSNNKAEWGRVLKLLSAEGLVKIKDGVEPVNATFDDVVENPKNLKFSYENDPALMTQFYQNGEGDLVVMDIATYNRREKMLHLREELLSVEEDRLRGIAGYSLPELTNMLKNKINEVAKNGRNK